MPWHVCACIWTYKHNTKYTPIIHTHTHKDKRDYRMNSWIINIFKTLANLYIKIFLWFTSFSIMCVYICVYLSVCTYLLGREVSVSVCVCVFVGIYTRFQVPTETRRKHWIPRNWSSCGLWGLWHGHWEVNSVCDEGEQMLLILKAPLKHHMGWFSWCAWG